MRQEAATTARILNKRLSRTMKAKRYNTLAACIKTSYDNDIAWPLAVERFHTESDSYMSLRLGLYALSALASRGFRASARAANATRLLRKPLTIFIRVSAIRFAKGPHEAATAVVPRMTRDLIQCERARGELMGRLSHAQVAKNSHRRATHQVSKPLHEGRTTQGCTLR